MPCTTLAFSNRLLDPADSSPTSIPILNFLGGIGSLHDRGLNITNLRYKTNEVHIREFGLHTGPYCPVFLTSRNFLFSSNPRGLLSFFLSFFLLLEFLQILYLGYSALSKVWGEWDDAEFISVCTAEKHNCMPCVNCKGSTFHFQSILLCLYFLYSNVYVQICAHKPVFSIPDGIPLLVLLFYQRLLGVITYLNSRQIKFI